YVQDRLEAIRVTRLELLLKGNSQRALKVYKRASSAWAKRVSLRQTEHPSASSVRDLAGQDRLPGDGFIGEAGKKGRDMQVPAVIDIGGGADLCPPVMRPLLRIGEPQPQVTIGNIQPHSFAAACASSPEQLCHGRCAGVKAVSRTDDHAGRQRQGNGEARRYGRYYRCVAAWIHVEKPDIVVAAFAVCLQESGAEAKVQKPIAVQIDVVITVQGNRDVDLRVDDARGCLQRRRQKHRGQHQRSFGRFHNPSLFWVADGRLRNGSPNCQLRGFCRRWRECATKPRRHTMLWR